MCARRQSRSMCVGAPLRTTNLIFFVGPGAVRWARGCAPWATSQDEAHPAHPCVVRIGCMPRAKALRACTCLYIPLGAARVPAVSRRACTPGARRLSSPGFRLHAAVPRPAFERLLYDHGFGTRSCKGCAELGSGCTARDLNRGGYLMMRCLAACALCLWSICRCCRAGSGK